MNEKEIAEIRRRYKAEKTGISRIRGAYVNEKREIISELDQSVAMMTETETDEILSLLKKALSGKVDTNLLDIHFTTQQVMESPEHKLLCNLRETALQDEEIIHQFYKKIIDSLELEGNYMILLAYDCYDVFTYRKDGAKDDESGEMFRYVLCAICPIKMAKPTLSYYVRENCFRNVIADSIISPPALGFMFPAFDNRSTNLYGALYYTRATDNSHKEFTDAIFNAGDLPMPATEQKETFRSVLADAAGEACSLDVVRSVHAQIHQAVEEHKISKEPEPLTVDKYAIRDMLEFCGVPEEGVEKFEQKFDKGFGQNAALSPRNLVEMNKFELKTPEVVIKVNPAHTDLVETRIIDGVKYVLIRADGGVEVNGIDVSIQADSEKDT
ncbi:MAG: DUF4317 domain-containing protein [Ruminococcaceae bacterium]|nr:DUF4317 domain-containing protein [Oscillospiraceae bacterium]